MSRKTDNRDEKTMAYKKIYILMTQYPGLDAKILRLRSGYPYTHASVGFEEDPDTFYTFVSKGFLVESIRRYEKPDRPSFQCALYEIEVSEDVYDELKKNVLKYKENRTNLKYSTMGLVMCFIKVPYRRRNHYFCSQFVAEVLQESGVLQLKKKSCLYFPKDIASHSQLKLIFEGNHLKFVEKFVDKNEKNKD